MKTAKQIKKEARERFDERFNHPLKQVDDLVKQARELKTKLAKEIEG